VAGDIFFGLLGLRSYRRRREGLVDPVKKITLQNLVALCHTMWAYFGDPKIVIGTRIQTEIHLKNWTRSGVSKSFKVIDSDTVRRVPINF